MLEGHNLQRNLSCVRKRFRLSASIWWKQKKWQKQPLYFVSFADARPGWTLGRSKVCGCWLVLLNWSKKCFRKISSQAAALLTRLPCQHVLNQKPLRLTSGNDVCMGMESLLAWDGWGTGESHPRGKVVPGCLAVLPWHC